MAEDGERPRVSLVEFAGRLLVGVRRVEEDMGLEGGARVVDAVEDKIRAVDRLHLVLLEDGQLQRLGDVPVHQTTAVERVVSA